MPKFLIVAATGFEIKGLLDHFKIAVTGEPGLFSAGPISVLITGVGMVNTAYYMGKFANDNYDFILNAGVCGAFNRSLQTGELVNVIYDTISELGAEDGDAFIKYHDMGLGGTNFYITRLVPEPKGLSALKRVWAITVNKVHGEESSIKKTAALYNVDVESMEGAAFFRGCLGLSTTYFQIRAISNYVEKRDKSKWNLPLAIDNLNFFLIQFINENSV